MRIPSYDDLTPSIPDISPDDVFASVGRLLPASGPVGIGLERATSNRGAVSSVLLYAALHGTPIEKLAAIARDFSPRIERYPPADVVLDVSGLGRLLGDAHAIGAELGRAGAEHVAVAASQIGARLLARARPGVTVVGHADVADALSVLPLSALNDVAVSASESSVEVLQRWGLKTLGEFATLPPADLSARLGQSGLALQQLARGIDPRPLVPDPAVPRFVQSMELEWPVDSLEPLSFVFARLLDPLSAALERADRGAAAVRLDLRLTDRTMHTRLLQLPAAMRDARVLRTLLLLDLESNPPSAAVDVVAIEADPAPARIVQYSLLERALPSVETLATLNARLSALVGVERCGSPALLDTHRPDAFEMKVFGAFGSPVPQVRPFSRSTIVRRFRPPVAVRVTVDRGRPVRMAIDRAGMPGGRVVQAAGPWRTSGAWWDPKAEGKPWDRDEWDVEFDEGTVCRIYRDRYGGVWFVEGVYD